MKKFLILFLAFLAVSCSRSQERATPATLENCDNLQVVKNSLINYVVYSGNLEKQNLQMAQTIQQANKIILSLAEVKTIAQLDSVCKVYGIPREVKGGDKHKPR